MKSWMFEPKNQFRTEKSKFDQNGRKRRTGILKSQYKWNTVKNSFYNQDEFI